nr:hypothetical protein B0A51_05310 [Rachicladosporium sp. CCFEE 5018]
MVNALAFLALLSTATAHYTFDRLQVNGAQVGKSWQYIRSHTRGYMPTKGNDILSNDFRCQPGSSGSNTDVYTVKPGDKVSFLGAYGVTSIEHPGPAQVYMSKAPSGSVKEYDGSGDWFKVREALFCSNPGNDGALKAAWCTWGQPGIEFEIPDRLPNGEYLVRVEHIPLHGAQGKPGGAEFYYSCGQLKIEGASSSAWLPTRTAKIPGMIQPDDAAVTFNIWTTVKSYPFSPGSELIIGGTTWGTADGSSKGVVKQLTKRTIGMVGSAAVRARSMIGL